MTASYRNSHPDWPDPAIFSTGAAGAQSYASASTQRTVDGSASPERVSEALLDTVRSLAGRGG